MYALAAIHGWEQKRLGPLPVGGVPFSWGGGAKQGNRESRRIDIGGPGKNSGSSRRLLVAEQTGQKDILAPFLAVGGHRRCLDAIPLGIHRCVLTTREAKGCSGEGSRAGRRRSRAERLGRPRARREQSRSGPSW